MRRVYIALALGVVAALGLAPLGSVEVASLAGWDVAAGAFLLAVWGTIGRADGDHTKGIAGREDETRGSARLLLVAASLASLVGVGVALNFAGQQDGAAQVALVGLTVLTIVVSWTVVNTVYTLRYADLHFGSADGISFGDAVPGTPSYRDFAYLAFTIGMTYAVSDSTLGDPRIRRTVLAHALLSYLFGVVIVSGSVGFITGLVG